MEERTKEKLSHMNPEELEYILSNSELYDEETVKYAMYLLYGSDSGWEREESGKHRKTLYMLIAFCAVLLVVIIFTIVIAYQNAIRRQEAKQEQILQQQAEKQEQMLQQQAAADRVNNLCDELNELEYMADDSAYYKAKDKLSEVEQLIEKNSLDESYSKKYNDTDAYIEDLKAFYDFDVIYENDYHMDLANMRLMSNKIGKIKTQKVLSKLGGYMDGLASDAENIILINSMRNCWEQVRKETSSRSLKRIIYWDESSKRFHPAMRDESVYARTLEALPDSGVYFCLDWSYFNLPIETLNNIEQNGNRALIVSYDEPDETGYRRGWVRYWYTGADVKARKLGSSLVFDVTTYSSGKTQQTTLSVEELFSFALVQPTAVKPTAKDDDEIKYRVRKSPNDADSQIGAFKELENAKNTANSHKYEGYKVYDMSGSLIYDPSA